MPMSDDGGTYADERRTLRSSTVVTRALFFTVTRLLPAITYSVAIADLYIL